MNESQRFSEYCVNCGLKRDEGASFCTSCGESLRDPNLSREASSPKLSLATQSASQGLGYRGDLLSYDPITGTRKEIDRRHDFDALRAFAMFLGIALHAALSFFEMPWPVQDSQQHHGFELAVSAIHGFRMPLFFLMSGFFTTMLWRRRGLRSLVHQRLKRVGLPLILALATIVPAMNCMFVITAVIPLEKMFESADSKDPYLRIFADAKSGNTDAVKEHILKGIDINSVRDRELGLTPLSWAVIAGQKETVYLLIENRADINGKNRDGGTPLHAASFLGRAEIVNLLISNDADVNAKNDRNETPLDNLKTDMKITEDIADLLEIEIDSEKIKAGRVQSAELLLKHGAEWARGTRATKLIPTIFEGYLEFVYSDFLGLLIFMPIFHHLWFLWFLLWLIAGFVLLVKIANWFEWKGVVPKWVTLSPVKLLWLIPITIIPQLLMGKGGANPLFGPDTSAGILPLPHLLIYYGIFFAFGAFYYDTDDRTGKVSRLWWVTLPIGLFVLFPLAQEFSFGSLGFRLDATLGRALSVLIQAAYPWLMVFGLMGLFRFFVKEESYKIRYLSDSSYWLYLTHLPFIILAQFLLQYLQLPAVIKFIFVCLVVTIFLSFIYHYIVRYRWLGTLLNGPRVRPKQTLG